MEQQVTTTLVQSPAGTAPLRRKPKHLRQEKLYTKSARGFWRDEVKISQEEWDIIIGSDPLAVLVLRGRKRPLVHRMRPLAKPRVTPAGEEIWEVPREPQTSLGYVNEVYERDVSCPACGSPRMLITASGLSCLGCSQTLCTIEMEEARLKKVAAAEARGGKKDEDPKPGEGGDS